MSCGLLWLLFNHVSNSRSRCNHRIHIRFSLNYEIYDHGSFGFHGFAYGRLHVFTLRDTYASQPIGFGQLDIVRASYWRFRVVAAMEEMLPLAHHSQITIVHDRHLNGDTFLPQGSQFLNVHLNTPVAGHHPYLSARQAHLNAHGSREGKTHSAKATRGNVAVGVCPGVMTCSPHLVLSNISDNDGIIVRLRTYGFQDACWIWTLLVALNARVTLVVFSLPAAYFTNPCAMVAWLDRLDKSRQGFPGISHDRHSRSFDFVHL